MTTKNSRADALTDEQRIGLEKAMAWCPHGSSEANTIRELLAASPALQPAAALTDAERLLLTRVNDCTKQIDAADRNGIMKLIDRLIMSPVSNPTAAPIDAEVDAAARQYEGIPLDVARGLARAAILASPSSQPAAAAAADDREPVDEVLEIVASYGPYGRDINEGLRFQIVLADEVKRLRSLHEFYVSGAQARAASANETGAEGVAIPTEEMRLAMTQETPYFWRRSMDKSCYEVGIQTNDDWREVISDDQTILATFDDGDAAADHFDRLEFAWRYVRMLEAAPQPAQADARVEALASKHEQTAAHPGQPEPNYLRDTDRTIEEVCGLPEPRAEVTDDQSVKRFQAAIEGECDGLAITEDHARAILHYVNHGEPMRFQPKPHTKCHGCPLNPTCPSTTCGVPTPEPRAGVTLTSEQRSALDVAINCLRDRPDPLGIRENARDVLSDLLVANQIGERDASKSDKRDAERYQWLKKNCFDWGQPGEGDSFDYIALHFEHELLGRDDKTVDAAIDAARTGASS